MSRVNGSLSLGIELISRVNVPMPRVRGPISLEDGATSPVIVRSSRDDGPMPRVDAAMPWDRGPISSVHEPMPQVSEPISRVNGPRLRVHGSMPRNDEAASRVHRPISREGAPMLQGAVSIFRGNGKEKRGARRPRPPAGQTMNPA